jgi:uncharacterized protein YceK
MKTLMIASAIVINLTGCAGVAQFYDQQDPCQTAQHLNRPQGYQAPNWCGAASGRTTIYNRQNQPVGYIK